MRKLKEVLRLHSLGLSQHQIARSCSISQSTVHEYLSAAEAAGVKWPAPENWDDQQIERTLFPQRPAPAIWRKHPEPDWAQIHQELQTHKNLTLQLVWQEVREGNPDGYGHSRFCDLYRRWLKKLDRVLRQEHRAGEKMFVDYAGATIPIHNPESGDVHPAAVFVAVLGASSYTFAEATTGQDLRNWIGSHMRAWEFFGGVTEVVVPDNLKSAVTHPSYYEPDLNPTYRDLGEHYAVAIIPARPYRPREKAKAEVGVQVVQRWIIAALRKHKFFSLAEANQAIGALLVRLNQRPFRKREGSRATLFAQLDRPALKPLPAARYQFGEWETARVNIDYHTEVERHYYSVPYALVHQQVDVHLTGDTLEVLHRGVRIASHVRSYVTGKATMLIEHMPGLRRAFGQHQLGFYGECQPLAEEKAFAAFLRTLFRQDWVVYAKKPFGGPDHVLQYLARYTHRVAISNHRLLSVDDSSVSFRWKDYAHHSKCRMMTLSHEEFLRRLVQHVLPKGLPRIRYFGWLANRRRRKLLPLCRTLLGAMPSDSASTPTGYETALPQCPCCGGAMRVIERLTARQILREEQRQVCTIDSS